MEIQEEEASSPQKVASERKSRMETEEETPLFSKVPLLHLQLETRHIYFARDLRFQLFFGRECADARAPPGNQWLHQIYIDIVNCLM